MKTLTLVFLLSAICLSAADKQTAKKEVRTKPASQPADVVIPAGAQETGDGSFRFTDKQGKTWLYRHTPFGIAKSEEKPAAAAQLPQEDLQTKATVTGDSVHFERPTPFGVTKWDKKIAELDANEQHILDRQKSKQ